MDAQDADDNMSEYESVNLSELDDSDVVREDGSRSEPSTPVQTGSPQRPEITSAQIINSPSPRKAPSSLAQGLARLEAARDRKPVNFKRKQVISKKGSSPASQHSKGLFAQTKLAVDSNGSNADLNPSGTGAVSNRPVLVPRKPASAVQRRKLAGAGVKENSIVTKLAMQHVDVQSSQESDSSSEEDAEMEDVRIEPEEMEAPEERPANQTVDKSSNAAGESSEAPSPDFPSSPGTGKIRDMPISKKTSSAEGNAVESSQLGKTSSLSPVKALDDAIEEAEGDSDSSEEEDSGGDSTYEPSLPTRIHSKNQAQAKRVVRGRKKINESAHGKAMIDGEAQTRGQTEMDGSQSSDDSFSSEEEPSEEVDDPSFINLSQHIKNLAASENGEADDAKHIEGNKNGMASKENDVLSQAPVEQTETPNAKQSDAVKDSAATRSTPLARRSIDLKKKVSAKAASSAIKSPRAKSGSVKSGTTRAVDTKSDKSPKITNAASASMEAAEAATPTKAAKTKKSGEDSSPLEAVIESSLEPTKPATPKSNGSAVKKKRSILARKNQSPVAVKAALAAARAATAAGMAAMAVKSSTIGQPQEDPENPAKVATPSMQAKGKKKSTKVAEKQGHEKEKSTHSSAQSTDDNELEPDSNQAPSEAGVISPSRGASKKAGAQVAEQPSRKDRASKRNDLQTASAEQGEDPAGVRSGALIDDAPVRKHVKKSASTSEKKGKRVAGVVAQRIAEMLDGAEHGKKQKSTNSDDQTKNMDMKNDSSSLENETAKNAKKLRKSSKRKIVSRSVAAKSKQGLPENEVIILDEDGQNKQKSRKHAGKDVNVVSKASKEGGERTDDMEEDAEMAEPTEVETGAELVNTDTLDTKAQKESDDKSVSAANSNFTSNLGRKVEEKKGRGIAKQMAKDSEPKQQKDCEGENDGDDTEQMMQGEHGGNEQMKAPHSSDAGRSEESDETGDEKKVEVEVEGGTNLKAGLRQVDESGEENKVEVEGVDDRGSQLEQSREGGKNTRRMTIGEPSRRVGFVDVEAPRKRSRRLSEPWTSTIPTMKEGQMLDVSVLNDASVQLGKDLFRKVEDRLAQFTQWMNDAVDTFVLDCKEKMNSAAANEDASRPWRGPRKYRLEARVQALKEETQLQMWECMKGLATGVSRTIREEGLPDVSLEEVFTEEQMIGMNGVNNEKAMHDNDGGVLEQNGSRKRSRQVESEKGSEAFGEITVGRKAKRAKRSAVVNGGKGDATKNESKAQEATRAEGHETGDNEWKGKQTQMQEQPEAVVAHKVDSDDEPLVKSQKNVGHAKRGTRVKGGKKSGGTGSKSVPRRKAGAAPTKLVEATEGEVNR